MVHPNIFKTKNDWALVSLRSKKYIPTNSHEKQIARIVKEITGVDPYFQIHARDAELVRSRQLFLSMVKKYTPRTFESTGSLIGFNYCTVIHAVKVMRNMYETDKKFREIYERIDQRVKQLN